METLFLVSSFIFGTMIGSFLNVLILRLPNEETLTGRSHCMFCKHELGVFDLVPLLSFLLLLGRCRYCRVKISPRYFIIEMLVALLFTLNYWLILPMTTLGFLALLFSWISISILVCVFVVDLEHFIILDNIIFPGAVILLAIHLVSDILVGNSIISLNSLFLLSIISGLLAALPFFLVWFISKGEWMGFGDVKLAIFLGICLGFPNIFVGLMLSVLLGGLVSVFLLGFTKSTLKTHLPFGTFLAVGSIITLFYGNLILDWYLSILGF